MPKVLTIDDFSIGKDTRKGASVADANRMREFKNSYARTGKGYRKRNGTIKIKTLESGTKGLGAGDGELHTFTQGAGVTHTNPVVKATYKPITPKTPGLDDLVSGGVYTGLKSAVFVIEIDANGTPDTFTWRKDSEAATTGVAITGSAQTLQDGVTINFGATTGHTLEDRWLVRTIVVTPHRIIGSTIGNPVFAGAGLNDLKSSEIYTGSGTPVFTVEIDSVISKSLTAFAEKIAGAITVFAADNTGPISAFADAGGGFTTVTDTGHGRADGQKLRISGTTSYNGAFEISSVTTNTFNIPVTFVSDDGTGTWHHRTKVTSVSHGLVATNDVKISGTTNYEGTHLSVAIDDGDIFVIDTPFVADDATGNFIITPASGITVVTSAAHGFPDGKNIQAEGTTNYNGLHEVSNPQTNTFEIAVSFVVDDGTGTAEQSPNTFKWKKDSGGYTSGVEITGENQVLQEGVHINFGALVGHTLTDIWTITIVASITVDKIHFFDIFLRTIYVAAEYSNGTILHHYLDGGDPTRIIDVNCPQSKGVLKLQQKIWAIDDDTVGFCKTGNPRDWTSPQDAGFLPVGIHQEGNQESLVLGAFGKNQMVVFFVDGGQLWTVDPDPSLHLFEQGLAATQSRYHRSAARLSQDLYYLSDLGPRSIAENILNSTNKQELDIGSPLDEDFEGILPITPTDKPIGKFYSARGQDWIAIGKNVYVFTESKTAKLASWSIYTYPWVIDDLGELDGIMYFRSGDNVYQDAPGIHTDAGAVVGDPVFVGSGLDDLSSGGAFTDAPDAVFTIEIDFLSAPDTFKWKKGSGAYTTGVAITGSAQTLSDGVTITFLATTGHSLGDIWTVDTGHVPFESEAVLPFLNAKSPAIEKYWESMDFSGKGTARVSFKYDAGDDTLETDETEVTNVTSPGLGIPIEITAPSIAPVIKNSADEEFEVDSISLHFNSLGVI